MSARKQPKSKKTSVVSKSKNEALLITVKAGATLSKAQTEFNRLMKQLETERAKQLKKRKTLDKALATCMEKVMPLVDESKRRDAEVVLTGHRMMKSTKLNAKDRRSFGDCLSSKAQDLLGDTYGLSDEVITQLKALVAELGPSEQDKALDAIDKAAFEGFCANIVNEAKKVGVDLDLSDLDYDADPLELERIIRERLAALAPEIEKRSAEEKQREPKLSKAQLEQQRKAAEIQEAKTRDLKTL